LISQISFSKESKFGVGNGVSFRKRFRDLQYLHQ
jgi:hypothetical protein